MSKKRFTDDRKQLLIRYKLHSRNQHSDKNKYEIL